jgi:glutamyl-tRNA reductase
MKRVFEWPRVLAIIAFPSTRFEEVYITSVRSNAYGGRGGQHSINSRILLVGTNHKHAPLDVRERLSCHAEEQMARLKSVAANSGCIAEAALLSTCNRTELYAVSADPVEAERTLIELLSRWSRITVDELKQYLYALLDDEAVRHLFEVSSGLDSLVLGETQIHDQVREAGRLANRAGTSGRLLADLFRTAYAISFRVLKETGLSVEDRSVSTVAIELLKKQSAQQPIRSILLIGAGKMIKLAASDISVLGSPQVWVANRTAQRAEELSMRTGGKAVQFDMIPWALERVDAVLSCTSASKYLITRPDLAAVVQQRHGEPLVIVDASVPRNIDPEVAKVPGVRLFNIDDLASIVTAKGNGELQTRIDAAEKLVRAETGHFLARIHSFDADDTLKALRQFAEEIREKELERALRQMGHVSVREREILDILTKRIVNKLLHEPTARLKEHVGNGDGENYEAAIRDLFAIDREAE